MLSWQIRTSVSALSSPTSTFSSSRRAPHLKIPHCSLRAQKIPVQNLQFPSPVEATKLNSLEHGVPDDGTGKGDKAISGIQVPRQRYIPISKADLLNAIGLMFDSQQDIDHFLLLSSCLDSILHAEHKNILEEMRISYSLTHSTEDKGMINEDTSSSERKFVTNMAGDSTTGVGSMERCREENVEPDNSMFSSYGLDLTYLFSSSTNNMKKNSGAESRVAVATQFQRAFMQLLYDAQFEELSARDLMLTSALNTDYLLTLPIYVDWKKASESNAIIFKRGYATERQKGLLIVEKLDYLQSKLLQGIFFVISKPLGKLGIWINEVILSFMETWMSPS